MYRKSAVPYELPFSFAGYIVNNLDAFVTWTKYY